jgi:hypothetical protein
MNSQTMMDYDINEIIEQVCSGEDTAAQDDDDDDEIADWYPEVYVVMVNGFRGGGKTVLVCDWGGYYLQNTEIPVFTNLDYNMERLRAEGFANLPQPIDWDGIIARRVDPPAGALNQLDEIDTYLDKLRTTTNQNILATKFMEQLRKRSLKFILSCQFGNYLPYGTMDQVDLLIQAQDLFFTSAGRESGLHKGEKFLYTCTDKSGLFTGGRRFPWWFTVDGRKVWGYFETDKLHDLTQFAKKFKIEQEDQTVDSSKGAQEQEREIGQFRDTIGLVWGSQLMGFLQSNKERINLNDLGNKVRVTMDQIESVLWDIKGPSREILETSYKQLLQMARNRKDGVITRQGRILEILKPEAMRRADEELVPLPQVAFEVTDTK